MKGETIYINRRRRRAIVQLDRDACSVVEFIEPDAFEVGDLLGGDLRVPVATKWSRRAQANAQSTSLYATATAH